MTDDRPVTTGTGTPAVRPRAAGLEVASLLGTVAAVLWLPFLVRPGHAPIAVLVAVALLAGASGVLVTSSPDGGSTPSPRAPPTRRRSRRRRPRTEPSPRSSCSATNRRAQRHSVELAQQPGRAR